MPLNTEGQSPKPERSHAPQNSLLFDKIIPALLIVLGIITVALILFAAGVLMGIIHF
jgi:hypothetical protein